MEINSDSLQEFRQDFNTAVEDLQEKYGLSINAKRIIYNKSGFRFKVEVTNSKPEDAERVRFENAIRECGWKFPLRDASSYNMEVWFPELNECNLIGISTRSKKYPILIRAQETGKVYKYTYSGFEKWMKMPEKFKAFKELNNGSNK